MTRRTILLGASLLVTASAHAGQIDRSLEDILRQSPPDKPVSTLVYLADQVDTTEVVHLLNVQPTSMAVRNRVVLTELMARAEATQGELLGALADEQAAGAVTRIQPYWLVNAVRVDGTPAAIRRLARRADVELVFFNPRIELIDPIDAFIEQPQGGIAGGVEPGINAINAPDAWAIGVDGTGALVSSLDTGVAGTHAALASRWRGLNPAYTGHPDWAFFDPVTGWTFPQDSASHGTHTMGTICGGAPGNSIGVAPGAEWIHAAVIDRVSIAQTVADAILAFQWVVNPDGDLGTSFDVPDVCSNSWGLADAHGYADCDNLFWSFLDNCEAAGVVIVFAAGNEGAGGLRRPADRATDELRTFAVAALDANSAGLPIAGFSSRGPTTCTPFGGAAIKPEIAAPGVGVISATPNGGYGSNSGTSMATPHIAGVVALLRSANPDLSPEQVKQIMIDTAVDLGAAGNDNDYGYGIVDAFAAVQLALETVALSFQFPDGFPTFLDPNGGTTIRVEVSGQAVQPNPGTGKLHYSTGGAYTAVAMTEIEPNVYDAVFPGFECGTVVHYYFSAQAEGGEIAVNPFGAPDLSYSGEAYSGLMIGFDDNFESDLGWSVANDAALTDGAWNRGVPVGGGDRGDPPTDADGSGQCYLTDNVDGNSDVDGGTTTLTSPNMDGTDPDAMLSYSRWYSNTFGSAPESDVFVVEISDDGGATWQNLETVGPAGPEVNGSWITKSFLIADIAGIDNTNQIRVRFHASDLGDGSVVEAGVDAVRISALFCEGDGIPGDLDGDGDVDPADLAALLAAWGPCPGCPADLDGDGVVGPSDLAIQLANWG